MWHDNVGYDRLGNPIGGWIRSVQPGITFPGGSQGGMLGQLPTSQGFGGAPAPAGGAQPGAPAPTAPSAPSGGGITVGQPGPMQKELYAGNIEYKNGLDSGSRNMNSLMQQMTQVQRLMRNFTTNGAANVRTQFGQYLNGVGASKDLQNELANGDLSSSQAAQKLFLGIGSQVASNLIHAGGGRLTQTEWSKVLSSGSANINLTPAAISKIYTSMRESQAAINLERDHFYRRLGESSYDMNNVQKDGADLVNSYIDAREKAPL